MEENLLLNEKRKLTLPLIPTVFLGIVTVWTIILFCINMVLASGNEAISEKISDYESKINILKQQKIVQVQELLEINKVKLQKLETNNEIVKYIDHLKDISTKYWIVFSGFSIADWEIKTEVEVSEFLLKSSAPYVKVRDFIKKYREDEAKTALFDLTFINSFTSTDWSIKFSVNFKIKDQRAKAIAENTEKQNTTNTWTLDDNTTTNE